MRTGVVGVADRVAGLLVARRPLGLFAARLVVGAWALAL